jgi:hypothetical protein
VEEWFAGRMEGLREGVRVNSGHSDKVELLKGQWEWCNSKELKSSHEMNWLKIHEQFAQDMVYHFLKK